MHSGTHSHSRPLVGITTDIVEGSGGRLKADCGLAYAKCIAAAGGLPLLLPPIPDLIAEHLAICSGIVLTGGDDPRMEPFGEPTHPAAKPMHPLRQEYETALLQALRERHPQKPVLGVCLGMQMMALTAGGTLNQHLPDTLPHAERHRGTHPIVATGDPPPRLRVQAGNAWSNHHQAIAAPGGLLVVAHSDDDLIEAVADPERPFYLGVQWHPERTEDVSLGQGLFDRLLEAIRSTR